MLRLFVILIAAGLLVTLVAPEPSRAWSYDALERPQGTNSKLDRLQWAIHQIRALGHEARALELAGVTLTWKGKRLVDQEAIGLAHRGYVKLAMELGLIEPLESQMVEVSPGHYRVLPGPRFAPQSPRRQELALAL